MHRPWRDSQRLGVTEAVGRRADGLSPFLPQTPSPSSSILLSTQQPDCHGLHQQLTCPLTSSQIWPRNWQDRRGQEERENGVFIPPTIPSQALGWAVVCSSPQGHGPPPGPFSTMTGLAGLVTTPFPCSLLLQRAVQGSLQLLPPGCFTTPCQILLTLPPPLQILLHKTFFTYPF